MPQELLQGVVRVPARTGIRSNVFDPSHLENLRVDPVISETQALLWLFFLLGQ